MLNAENRFRAYSYLAPLILLFLPCFAFGETSGPAAVYSTETFRLELSADGQVTGFFDLRDGSNRLAPKGGAPFCLIRTAPGGKEIPSTSLEKKGDEIVLGFRAADEGGQSDSPKVTLRCAAEKDFIAVEVVAAEGDFYDLQFARIPLALDYAEPDAFGASAAAMKLNTMPLAMPGRSTLLGGRTFRSIDPIGARIALVAAPEKTLRDRLKAAVSTIPPGTMPVSRAGGPWAAESDKSRGNYIITSTPITADEVDGWISHLEKFGIDQIDFHQGGAFRQGDFHFNESAYPGGIADFRRMTDRLREHGMIAGLHTYAEFLAPSSKYVSPVPHPDLDVMRAFTLAADLTADAAELTTAESTADVSTVTGFFVRNSLYLRIDNELIRFGKPSKTEPFGFAECERGACGTTPAAHAKGANVEQMTQMFGLFAPKVESDLFLEIARETARAYNEGGFGMIYLDALDGTHAIVEDKSLIGYYDTLFVNEIIKNCVEPPLMEYSTMNANLWLARSRMGAWDSAHRGYRQFFDKHFASNRQSADAAYLPGQIGWLALSPAAGDDLPGYQRQPLFPEDVHYLGAKTLAHNYGYSFLDIPLTGIAPAAERNGRLLAEYNKIRRGGKLPAKTLEKLRDPSLDVVLFPGTAEGDVPKIVPARYQYFKPTDEAKSFEFENPYGGQTPAIRIENGYAVGDYGEVDAPTLIAFDENKPVENLTSAAFDPPLDLSGRLAMGLWVFGDGGNQKINVRVESPAALVSGHNDHFITVDFTGWRYFSLAEAQNGQEPPVNWPIPCGNIYVEYREKVHYKAISAVHLMIVGDAKNLRFRTLKALPLQPTALRAPTLEAGGEKIVFQGEIPSGHYLEYDPASDGGKARVLAPDGAVVSEPEVVGTLKFPAQKSECVTFSAEKSDSVPLRVRVVLRTLGDTL